MPGFGSSHRRKAPAPSPGIDVKADDVLDLRGEVRIVGDLEAAREMRPEAVFGPDALHVRVADAHFFRHRSHAPVRGIGILDDLELHGSAERLSARRLGAAFDQTSDAGLGKIVQRRTVVFEIPTSRIIATTP